MSIRWFGKMYDAPMYFSTAETSTPVGIPCVHCDEVIVEGDDGVVLPGGGISPVCDPFHDGRVFNEDGVPMCAFHRSCFLRGTIGSVAHVQRRCSCYVPGADEGDPPEMTRRQAAEAAVVAWQNTHR